MELIANPLSIKYPVKSLISIDTLIALSKFSV